MDIGTARPNLLNAWWWFVVGALALGYSYAVPDGLTVLAILARITAAGLAVMGLVVVVTHFRVPTGRPPTSDPVTQRRSLIFGCRPTRRSAVVERSVAISVAA
jgi:hypothetical protein